MKYVPAMLGLAAICLSLASAARAADVAAGKVLFQKTCANCHSTEAGVNKVGPTLFDINVPYNAPPPMAKVCLDCFWLSEVAAGTAK